KEVRRRRAAGRVLIARSAAKCSLDQPTAFFPYEGSSVPMTFGLPLTTPSERRMTLMSFSSGFSLFAMNVFDCFVLLMMSPAKLVLSCAGVAPTFAAMIFCASAGCERKYAIACCQVLSAPTTAAGFALANAALTIRQSEIRPGRAAPA